METKQRFVAYYRVSTDKQGISGLGIEAQKQAVARFLACLAFELLGEFFEVESGARNDRPKLQEALALAKRHKATLVIAKLDRLSRNAEFLLGLQNAGIDFVATDMPSADRFTVGILALVAQRERELISQRTKAGLAIAKQRGARLGNPRPLASLERGHLTQATNKQNFAREAYKAIEDIRGTGVKTLDGVATCLNKRGERTARGGQWTATAVSRVCALFGGDSVIIEPSQG